MKKYLFLAIVLINAIGLSTLQFIDLNNVMVVKNAIAEDGELYDTSNFNSGSENFTESSEDPECGECTTTSTSCWETLTCEGTGNEQCNPVNKKGSCYSVNCGEDDNCNFNSCPCTTN